MKKKLNCILLVDDDDIVNFINKKVIKAADIAEHVEVKLNGKEAISFLTRDPNGEVLDLHPSLILLDINMPVMNGWEFMQAFGALKMANDLTPVVVVLSTTNNPDDKIKAANFPHVAEFKNKPLAISDLEEIMQKYF